MEEETLLFRHLPSELSIEERQDLLHFLGASRVKVMGKTGPMKNTAFAVFESKEHASKVLSQLHQVEFLGSRLSVEFAKNELRHDVPSVVDNEGVCKKADVELSDAKEKIDTREIKFDCTFNIWGLKHPRRPELHYLYPPPNLSILTNIMNALAAVPKFYVQVLHLMNKMDLPAPFGPVTPTPPTCPVVREFPMPDDDIDQKEMDISSETESELESGEDEKEKKRRLKEGQPPKRLCSRLQKKKQIRKIPRLSELQPSGFSIQPSVSVNVSEVFDHVTDSGMEVKKIELKLPSTILPPLMPSQSPQGLALQSDSFSDPLTYTGSSIWKKDPPLLWPLQSHQQLQPMPLSNEGQKLQLSHHQTLPALPQIEQQPPEERPLVANQTHWDGQGGPCSSESNNYTSQDRLEAGGFGFLEPVCKEKETKADKEESIEKEWTKSQFITSEELQKSRLSHSEMKELSVFRRYNEGELSCRLYIKNVAKQVIEEDIHWIYGRYVNWDSKIETNIFDIRLMKEGRMKGQAFVTLPTEEAALAAIKETNGFMLKDKPLVVQFARSAKVREDDTETRHQN